MAPMAKSARANSAHRPPQGKPLLPLLTVGFCVDQEGEAKLIAAGVHPDQIWMRGRGAESLEWAVRWLRRRPGMVCVADDLRIFGASRKEISAWMARFHVQGVVVNDVVEEETNPHLLVQRAFVAIAASAGMRNHRTARRRGRLGGIGKGIAAAVERENGVPAWLIRKIVNHPALTWAIIKDLIGEVASISTLRRRYIEQE